MSDAAPRSRYNLFPKIPAPLQRLFDAVPLVTYPANDLPARRPATEDIPTLFVFISEEDAAKGKPSFNPTCLKWQTYLKISRIPFRISPSTNHASPTGALPFLLRPPYPETNAFGPLISAHELDKFATWCSSSQAIPPWSRPRAEAYTSLLTAAIRPAWLHTLYLSPANAPLLTKLYTAPASRHRTVQAVLGHQLRRAAMAEVVKASGTPAIDAAALYASAREAFAALSELLAEGSRSDDFQGPEVGEWFFGMPDPTLFDATVFSYTHLMLDEGMDWGDRTLGRMLEEFPNLVRHRGKISDRCWGSSLSAEAAVKTPGGGDPGVEDSAVWEKI